MVESQTAFRSRWYEGSPPTDKARAIKTDFNLFAHDYGRIVGDDEPSVVYGLSEVGPGTTHPLRI